MGIYSFGKSFVAVPSGTRCSRGCPQVVRCPGAQRPAGPAGSGPRKARRAAPGSCPAAPGCRGTRSASRRAAVRPVPCSAAATRKNPKALRLAAGRPRSGEAPAGNGSPGKGSPADGCGDGAHRPPPPPREAVSRDRARRAPSVRHFRLGRWRRH